MPNSKRRVIILWEPLAMLAVGVALLIIVQPASALGRLLVGIFAGLLLVSAGVTFVIWMKDNLKG